MKFAAADNHHRHADDTAIHTDFFVQGIRPNDNNEYPSENGCEMSAFRHANYTSFPVFIQGETKA
jgi:hypothetical protein